MPAQLSFPNHSFRLMLYLEWILLGMTVLTEIRPTRFGPPPFTLAISLLSVLILGLMGLKLPMHHLVPKLAYTSLEFSLLLAAFLPGYRLNIFPLLGLIIVIRSCLMFQLGGRLVVAGLTFITFLYLLSINQQGFPSPRRFVVPEAVTNTIWTLKFNSAMTFGLTLVFVLLLVNALLAERHSRQQILQANDQLRQYALRIEDQAMLQERNRIAREIHDALGHHLTALTIQLENALTFLPPNAEKSSQFLEEAQRLGDLAFQDVRRSITTLRSNPLQGQSLTTAITQTVNQFQTTTGITPDCQLQLTQPLPLEVSTALYRIVQESLTNIHRHSQATQVTIRLHCDGQRPLSEHRNSIYLQIADNGQGFDPAVNTTGFGLQGMRERIIALNGHFQLQSQPGAGCTMDVQIPLPRGVQ